MRSFISALSSKHFVILHGTASSPEANWFPWLVTELGNRGAKITVPKLPTPEGQSLENWLSSFHDQVGAVSGDMILIGHSIGAGLILRLLEAAQERIAGCFLASAWEGLLGRSDFDPLIESFYSEPLDYDGIRERCGKFFLYHGNDDPYVPLQKGLELAMNLGAILAIVESGGHLNGESNYTQFPKLLEDILDFHERK